MSRTPYTPNEAQIRNLMRFADCPMGEANRALTATHGYWDEAVALIEERKRTPRRATTPQPEFANVR